MKTGFVLIIISVFLASLDPLMPAGSIVISWSAVLGNKKIDWWGATAVLISGLIRDVALVNRLGSSSAIAISVWLVSALTSARLNRPLLVTAGAAVSGSLVFSLINKPIHFIELGVTAAMAVFFTGAWQWLAERNESIRLRPR